MIHPVTILVIRKIETTRSTVQLTDVFLDKDVGHSTEDSPHSKIGARRTCQLDSISDLAVVRTDNTESLRCRFEARNASVAVEAPVS